MTDGLRAWRDTWPTLGARVYIDATAVVIGQVTLGDDSSVWPTAVIRGDVHVITVGARSNVQDGCVLHVTHDGRFWPGGFRLDVGDDVTVGHRAILHGCRVGNRCLIGMGAVVMDGAVLADEVLVAGAAVVTPGTQCETRSLYAGNPARRVRALKSREVELLSYSAHRYVAIKDEYLAADVAGAGRPAPGRT